MPAWESAQRTLGRCSRGFNRPRSSFPASAVNPPPVTRHPRPASHPKAPSRTGQIVTEWPACEPGRKHSASWHRPVRRPTPPSPPLRVPYRLPYLFLRSMPGASGPGVRTQARPLPRRRRISVQPAPPAADPHAELLERLRAGDEAAFERLVREQTPILLRVARRLLHSEDEARDAVQDAFVSAFRALPNFRGDSRLGTWIYRIAVNAALARLRA